MREAILYTDVTKFIGQSHWFSAPEIGAAMLVAMHIAAHGQVNVKDLRRIARLHGRAQWLSEYAEPHLFIRDGEHLYLRPDIFRVRYRGSDRKRGKLSIAVREEIHERDQYRCTYCDTGEGPFEIDHIHPVSRGGTDDIENLCLACAPCNRAKSDKLLEEWSR